MPLKSFWLPRYTSEIMSFSTILAALLDLLLKNMFRSIHLGILRLCCSQMTHSEEIGLETIAICVGSITHSEHDLPVPFKFNLTLISTSTTQICLQSTR